MSILRLDGERVSVRPGEILGRYRILRRIAQGGMAEVFLGQVPETGQLAAIKRLHRHLADLPGFLQMFVHEANLAARLRHPNIVEVLEVGEAAEQRFIAMEYLHGEDVNSLLRRAALKRRRVPVEHALRIVLGMCEGLHYAHEMRGDDGEPLRLVHRDVSPQNVVVRFDGGVKLLDFGIAKTGTAAATRTGTLKGKISYMSPEQCVGDPLDRRSDLFSLGIVLYELSLGRKLFRGRTDYDVMRTIVEGMVSPPRVFDPDYDPELEMVVMRALEKDPAKRFQTARDMAAALEGVVQRMDLVPTAMGLQRFVEDLFDDQVAAWRAAQAAGRTLAEHLAEVGDPAWSRRESGEEEAEAVEHRAGLELADTGQAPVMVIPANRVAPGAKAPVATVSEEHVPGTLADARIYEAAWASRVKRRLSKRMRRATSSLRDALRTAWRWAEGRPGYAWAARWAEGRPTLARATRWIGQGHRYLWVVGSAAVLVAGLSALAVRALRPAPTVPAGVALGIAGTGPAPSVAEDEAASAAHPGTAPGNGTAWAPSPRTGVTAALSPANGATGRLSVVTSPRSNVYVDGKYVGDSPVVLTLPAGKHKLRVRSVRDKVEHDTMVVVKRDRTAHYRKHLERRKKR